MPFTSLLSYNNDPLQLISAIAQWADQTDSVANKMQYGIIPTDYFYETLADGHTYRFRIADKNHYRTQSFTKTHYTVIADGVWSKSVAFNSNSTKGNDYSVSDLRKAYQTEILKQFTADQQASMVVAPVSSYKQDGTAVQIDDKIYPMSNFEMSGQKAYSNEKEVLPGGTESSNWHFDYMYSKSPSQDQTRRKSSFNATVNGGKDQWGSWYWLRAAGASGATSACIVGNRGNLGSDSWLMGIQANISHDDGSEGATVFKPHNYGPKTLKAGTLKCCIFVNTTGEVDKTFTPRLYKID